MTYWIVFIRSICSQHHLMEAPIIITAGLTHNTAKSLHGQTLNLYPDQ